MTHFVDTALEFAAKAHATQKRKGTDIPYIAHPAAVAMSLAELGCPETWVVAALLHDTLEDTGTSAAEIEAAFGAEVAEIVVGCSEPDKSLSWEERKRHTVTALHTASEGVRTVCCADKLHNLNSISRDLTLHGEALWKRFNRGKAEQAWYYRSLADALWKMPPPEVSRPLFERFRELTDKAFPV